MPKTQVKPIVLCTVTSEGTSGETCIERLESADYKLSDNAVEVLRAPGVIPNACTTYQIVVIPGTQFSDENRTQKKALEKATAAGLQQPSPEAACILRELSAPEQEEEGDTTIHQRLIIMHTPIKDRNEHPRLLGVNLDPKSRHLYTYLSEPEQKRPRHFGFVFIRQIEL